MVDIGGRLIADGLIEPAQLAAARDRQRREGGFLGHHLIGSGAIAHRDFYGVLAELWRTETRDLERDPPQPSLLLDLDVEETVELGWIACDLVDDTVIVATCVRPAEELVVEVQEHFPGRGIEFVGCTQRDLDAVALGVRRQRAAQGDRAVPQGDLVRLPHHIGAVVLALAGVPVAFALPLQVLGGALVGSCAIFLVGALTQSVVGYSALVNDVDTQRHEIARARGVAHPEAIDEPRPGDQDLPVYTVLVRLAGGDRALDALLENFSGVDYPWARTDAILLVADNDEATLDALRHAPRRAWIRVARVPDADFADVVRAYDHGLALARGRYVVAWEQDEAPARDQMRRAVSTFEKDLFDRLDQLDQVGQGAAPSPLLALRVLHRIGAGATHFARMAAADDALRLTRRASTRAGSTRWPDVTSVHCNMRLLRRAGGFASLIWQPSGAGVLRGDLAPRIGHLDSTSVRADVPGPLLWTRNRAESFAHMLLDTRLQTQRVVRPPEGQVRDLTWVRSLTAGLATTAMFLVYPFVLLGSVVATVRTVGSQHPSTETLALVVLTAVGLVLLVAIGAAAALLVRQRQWTAAVTALALPAHWFLHSAAAWSALVAVVLQPSLHRGRPERGA